MAQTQRIGSRIRERRVMRGLKQADLAQRAGISASYLNLIEHNRRRIGGKTLVRIAEELGVAPALLSEGAEATLVQALREAAGRALAGRSEQAAALDRAEEFAGRFPGWAQLLADLARQRSELETTVTALTDRLGHDPQLAASLHEVISTVTAIRSTASILADTKSLEPEWQARFHRNLNEDSQRLAQGAQSLVRYLEGAPDAGAEITSPQDEVQAFLEANAFHFPGLEGAGGGARIDAVLARSEHLQSDAARGLARVVLERYVRDARRLPMGEMEAALEAHGMVPEALAEALGVGLAQLFRRLAMLPAEVAGPVGLAICDGTGALLMRKPALGFAMPRSAAACALWPLYDLLAQPGAALRMRLRQGDVRVLALAVSEEAAPARFDRPALTRPHMLLLPDPGGEAAAGFRAREVGMSCQVCPLADCDARREPSILGGGF
ncbi:MAG: helix-turn-helix domain-containing protein [Roseovarius sp.]